MLDPTSRDSTGTPRPAPTWAALVVAVLFAGTGLIAGYGGALLLREGTGALAVSLGAFLLVSALVAFLLTGAVLAQHVARRRKLRKLGQL